MKEKIINRLVTVKSIVTLLLTLTFIGLSLKQVIAGDKFYDIFLMVMSFYFGTQLEKKKSDNAD